ncbi:MAG: LacI family transcriptional regulator [Clostridiaceae bacterium]|jgi:DNA-binding LacI/PurR family transcriptional regulator|nr:LacI family transcriptional regulator [Clostridiaceae bacterium]
MKKSFNICLLINSTSSPFEDLFYFEITRGILEKSKEYGYNIVISEINNSRKNKLPNIVYSNDTDGIIFLQDIDKDVRDEVKNTNIPFLVIDSHSVDNSITAINPDYFTASYTATNFLIKNGHKKIAFITSSFIPDFYDQTYSGFKKAMDEAMLSIKPEFIQVNSTNESTAFNCMEKILANNTAPTAVMCSVDMFAIGAMKCAKEKGYKIPLDISFIGIDDIFLSNYTEPKLTTVKIDKTFMGFLAMDMIIRKINAEEVENYIVKSNEATVRDSVINI